MTHRLVLACSALWIVAACGGSDPPAGGPAPGAGGGGTTGGGAMNSGGSGGQGGMTPLPETRATVSGDVTWNVQFDAEAIAAGATNCAYTRHYEGVQDESAKWLCPSCEVMFRATVEMTQGLQDCYSQISSDPPEVEWIGWGPGGVYYRGVGAGMTEQGTAMMAGADVTVANSVAADLPAPNGGLFGFGITGALVVDEEDGDPLHGFEPANSYDCGWPTSNAPEYTGDYKIVVGETVPDGLFLDACDEVVRLHDFEGDYLLIDMSAIDCPPCQQMASGEEAFVGSLALEGVDVHVITLLAPSLADPLGETTNSMLNNWVNTYGLQSPVLADRGWGLTMFLDAIGEGLGYPSWVLVAPDLTVVEFGSGFGGWAAHEASILAHAN
jgi:AhpC/TSA family